MHKFLNVHIFIVVCGFSFCMAVVCSGRCPTGFVAEFYENRVGYPMVPPPPPAPHAPGCVFRHHRGAREACGPYVRSRGRGAIGAPGVAEPGRHSAQQRAHRLALEQRLKPGGARGKKLQRCQGAPSRSRQRRFAERPGRLSSKESCAVSPRRTCTSKVLFSKCGLLSSK